MNKIKKIYMIGVKGVGMTMLAQFFSAQNIEIIGSDVADVYMTDEILKKSGVKVISGFDKNNIPKSVDLIIYSTAYNENTNEEVAAALAGKIKTLTYGQALKEVFNQKYGLAVVGSHGKTTTSAWLGFVMNEAGLQPNVMVGANVPQFGGAALVSKSDYLVIEADEYQNKFQNFTPKAVILNNIDYDHPDFFKTNADYVNVFVELIKKIPTAGFLVANNDDEQVKKIAQVNCRGKVITYSVGAEGDYVAYDLKFQAGKQFFKVKMKADDEEGYEFGEHDLGEFSISLLGRHNISNALAVIATCIELDIPLVQIRRNLAEFKGTARRMQVIGSFRGATIIDDYAHHPTEIKATLLAVKQAYPEKFLRVVFHPHTFTRTKALLDDFAVSFDLADELIVLDIYGSAREEQGGVHSEDLVLKIKNKNEKIKNILYISSLAETEKYLRENTSRGDLILLVGAGDVFRIGENLVKM